MNDVELMRMAPVNFKIWTVCFNWEEKMSEKQLSN